MLPAFRSKSSVFSFCGLMIALLCMPLICAWVGHPPREQAYAGISDAAGEIGWNVHEIFQDPTDADVLFLGSSLVTNGIEQQSVERALSRHLNRPTHVRILALNWQGIDLEYFLLRDYLSTHKAGLIVWNLPFPGSRDFEPHVKAFHWARYGEYSDAMQGLPLRYRFALYGEMVLGSGRELFSHLRRNRLGPEELNAPPRSADLGYYGNKFQIEPFYDLPVPPLNQAYESPPYQLVRVKKKPLDPYERHFAEKILELLRANRISLAFMHITIDTERNLDYMPERDNWPEVLHTAVPMIGAPSNLIFSHVSDKRYYLFFQDQHLNTNGSALFTADIIPSVIKAYDAAHPQQ